MKYTVQAVILGMGLVAVSLWATAQVPAAAYSASPWMASGLETDADQRDTILTIKKRVDEVNLVFIATDKHGKFVRDLQQADISILDDHRPPEAISDFHRVTDLPIEMGLLVDVSGSVRARFGFEKQAAVDFLQKTLRPGFDKAFVEGFNTRAQLTQDFTDNVAMLSNGVSRMQVGGGTALYDAVYRACRDKLAHEHPDHPVRKAIILVSDGEDNQSEVTRAQAIEMAQRSEVIIYAISTDDSGLVLRGDTVLAQMAAATGGKAFFPFKMKDITRSFASIEDELRSQYAVSYRPASFDPDGRYRSIQITSLKKDLQVRSRQGYFAPKQ